MPYLTGMLLIDAPASALNNAGQEAGAKTDNTIAVKRINTPDGGKYPYVSAQAFRYWLRTNLELSDTGWVAAPIQRQAKIAFTESNPISNWDDDLFGYMRAPSKKADAEGADKTPLMPLEKDREVTRVSPFRVGTLVSVAPSPIVDDFGTMTRQDGNPVPHEHQFYRAHLRGLFSLDLTSAGTFYDSERVGFKNLDKHRRDFAVEKGLAYVESGVRKQKAIRLPLDQRQLRVSTLVRGLGALNGGAKQALHYTDLTPAVVFAAVTKSGNHPFYRVIGASKSHQTVLDEAALTEILDVYADDFLSPVYIGWAQGFLTDERSKLAAFVDARRKSGKGPTLHEVVHPKAALTSLADDLRKSESAAWYE
jgi:CRISPR-associated protein Cst2